MKITEIRYPVGVQSFEKLRREGYLYIDKTGFIPRLLRNDYYFLSRPRRFGKSLLLSTLEAYFQGKRELFEGLEVSKYEHDWVEYPVVHVDFASMNVTTPRDLAFQLSLQLVDIAASYGVEIPADRRAANLAFEYLIRQLHDRTGRNVVVLIDEYDKGLLELLHDEQLLEESTRLLRPFFSVLKSHDRYIRFAFITGVSRFRNTTIFSGFNNPRDISMVPEFAAICGITRQELTSNLSEGIDALAEKFGHSREKTVETLLLRYDGYRFTEDEVYLCNPYSVLNAINDRKLDSYWVKVGTSKILVNYIRHSRLSLEGMTSDWVSEGMLGATFSAENPVALFFQSGYLTISDCDGFDGYRLRIPNQEVQEALALLFMPSYTGQTDSGVSGDIRRLRIAIHRGDVDGMMGILRAIVTSIPFHEIVGQPLEKHLHLCAHVIFMMLGSATRSEIANSAGRCDMVAETPWRVYVFEFKLDTPPSEALRQIDEKAYALPWEARGRQVTKIGVNFSSATRTIAGWEAVSE